MTDYIQIGLGIIIFLFYLITLVIALIIKGKLNKKSGIAFIYFIIVILFLISGRIFSIFFELEIINTIRRSYFEDAFKLVFALLFFLAIYHFNRSLRKTGRRSGSNFKEYKKSFGRKVIK